MGSHQQELEASIALILETARQHIAPELRPDIEYAAAAVKAVPEMLKVCGAAVGFAVNLRVSHPCWENHPDAGTLFAKALNALNKAGMTTESVWASASQTDASALEPHTEPVADKASKPT